MAGEGTAKGKPWGKSWDVDANRENYQRHKARRERVLAGIEQEQRRQHAPAQVMTPERTYEGRMHGYGMER
jgi:hypothetical protein